MTAVLCALSVIPAVLVAANYLLPTIANETNLILVASVTYGVAIASNLTFVYRNRPIDQSAIGWIISFGTVWFFSLMAFWYLRVYRVGISDLPPR